MFRRVLIAIGNLRGRHEGLLRWATELAPRGQIELLHILDDAPYAAALSQLPDKTMQEALSALEQRAMLALRRIARSSTLQGARVHIRVQRDGPTYEGIARRAIASNADLVITGSHGAHGPARWLFGSVDWELVRTCPCPLLIVGKPRPAHQRRIVAAVDPLHARDKPAALDKEILRVARLIAKGAGDELHLMHAWLPLAMLYPVSPSETAPLWVAAETEVQYEKTLRARVAKLTRQWRLPPGRMHLERGEIAEALPRLTGQLHARLVIMGAVSRSGLKRVLLGQSAQRVLNHVPADLLIVKPKGFRSPVPRRRLSAPLFLGPPC